MNSTLISKKKVREIFEVLTDSELRQLEDRVAGYGWLSDTARRAEVHVNTIKKILMKGYGYPETIKKIRNILTHENSAHQ